MHVPPGHRREKRSNRIATIVMYTEEPLSSHSVALTTIRTLQKERRPRSRNWKKISFLSSTWERMPGCSWIGEVENKSKQIARDWNLR